MGRRAFSPTPAQRQAVSVAAGAGESHESIAAGLGIARNTLRKHLAHELSAGAAQRRGEVVLALFDAAIRGSATAQKAYLARALLAD